MAASAVSAVSGRAVVTPPLTKRPWEQYQLTVCVKGTANCLNLPLFTANANRDAPTVCDLPGCEASTTYTVRALALQASGNIKSLPSDVAEFTTPAHSAPGVQVAASPAVTQTTASVVVTPPATRPTTGDWDKYVLTVCPTNPAAACFFRDCGTVKRSAVTKALATVSCPLTGLKQQTTYTVQAVAVKTTADPVKPIRSLASATDEFTTLAYS